MKNKKNKKRNKTPFFYCVTHFSFCHSFLVLSLISAFSIARVLFNILTNPGRAKKGCHEGVPKNGTIKGCHERVPNNIYKKVT
jgi:hypothetical protein